MNDEYIYQYPAPEYMERFKEMVAQRTTNTNGARKKVIVCFGISMAFLVLYCLPEFYRHIFITCCSDFFMRNSDTS